MSCTWRVDRSLVAEPFASDVTAILEADPGDWVVTCGARDPAVEAAGYAAYLAHPTTAPKFTDPANSAHCCVPALAVDVTLVVGDADDWTYTDAAWQRMIAAVRASPHCHSGADFPPPNPPDQDHIEASNWRSLRVVA
jgi:hypothetical protein